MRKPGVIEVTYDGLSTGAFSILKYHIVGRLKRVPNGLLLLFILIAALTFVRLRLLDMPLERDEGEYAYMGQLILQGIPPYSESYNMKFPGTYLMYALIMAIFGQTASGIHTGLIIINGASILLVYLLSRKMVEDIPAALSGGTYGILTLSPSVFGFAAHATHFVVLPALAGTLLLLRALDKEKLHLYFLSGALLGISVIMKQPGIFFVLFGAAYISWRHFFPLETPTEKAGSRRQYILDLAAFSTGAALTVLVTGIWLYAVDVIDRFWFWTVVYASRYATQVPFLNGFMRLKNSFIYVVDGFFLLWILAASGFAAVLFNKWSASGDRQAVLPDLRKPDKAFVILFVLFSFLSVCPGFYFREHYFVTLLPVVSLLTGIFISCLTSGRTVISRTWAKPAGVGIFILAAAVGVIREKDYFFYEDPVRLSGQIYTGNPFVESMVISRFIEGRTAPGDRIAVFGSEPQIFFYAGRRSATGYIYTYSLMEMHEYALPMQKEMATEIEASKPKFIIDVMVPGSWQGKDESEQFIFGWAKAYIGDNFDLVGVVDIIPPDMSVYKWFDDAKNYKAQSPWSLLIYERR